MQQTLPATHTAYVIDQASRSTTDTQIDYRQADILDLPALTEALRGADAVIHLAAIRSPDLAPPETVFRVNTLGAYHVTLACERLGISRIIYASSICYYGYLFRAKLVTPSYFPVDEKSPAYPEDSYSLSKWIGEKIMSAFVQRTNGSVANMRYAYLMAGGATGEPLTATGTLDFPADEASAKSWWTYVDLQDAAIVTWQALDYIANEPGLCEAFNIGADDTHTMTPSHKLLEQFFPDSAMRFSVPLEPKSCIALYSNMKAREVLGFRPTPSTWRTLIKRK
jgi:UDP-glucose 4-epimerase